MTEMTEEIKVGDLIKCSGHHDMVSTMVALFNVGYDTEFVYEQDGENGYWLRVVRIIQPFEKKWRIK